MGLIALLSSLVGCTKEPKKPAGPDNDTKPANTKTEKPDTDIEPGNKDENPGPGVYKKVIGCEYRINGYSISCHYSIKKSDDKEGSFVLDYSNMLNAVSDINCEINDDTMEAISKLCEELNVVSWDKFDEVDEEVLDGSGFSLYLSFEDGTYISASGDNRFPKNYGKFEDGLAEILKPSIELALEKERDKKYENGEYSQKLEMAMINYSGRGLSGSDSYSILIRDNSSTSTKADIEVKSASGEFIEEGSYRYYGDPENTDELLAKIQEILEKYKVYKWDGYDESTPDYNDREWFQLDFCYPQASISCCGCGDTENYAEVRKELLELVIEYLKEYTKEQG